MTEKNVADSTIQVTLGPTASFGEDLIISLKERMTMVTIISEEDNDEAIDSALSEKVIAKRLTSFGSYFNGKSGGNHSTHYGPFTLSRKPFSGEQVITDHYHECTSPTPCPSPTKSSKSYPRSLTPDHKYNFYQERFHRTRDAQPGSVVNKTADNSSA